MPNTVTMELNADEAALIEKTRALLSTFELRALVQGPPVSVDNDKLIVDRGHPFFEAWLMFVAAQGGCQPQDIHIAWGTVDGKLSLGVVPMMMVVNGKAERRIALQRRKQDQIGLSAEAKWAMPTGGFVNARGLEEADDAISRHAHDKGGVVLHPQAFPVVHLITKSAYGVTNEGRAEANGKVRRGRIYGTVGRALLVVDDEERAYMEAFAASKDMELRFVTEDEYESILETGKHTLDVNEEDFLRQLLADTLEAGPKRRIAAKAD